MQPSEGWSCGQCRSPRPELRLLRPSGSSWGQTQTLEQMLGCRLGCGWLGLGLELAGHRGVSGQAGGHGTFPWAA